MRPETAALRALLAAAAVAMASHEGPVPDVAPAELRRIRAGYLAGYYSAGRAEIMRQFTERDQALQANRDGKYVLWFEADLYDQLQITEILARLAGLGVPAGRITLICIGEHAGIARFGGLGELTAGQLRELPHTNACARLTPAALELATRAWAAFRAPSPGGLGAIAAARLGELRFLGEAFDRLSREYPAKRDGLSLTERRVLAAVADGAPDAGTAFVRAAARETRPYMGDTTCFGRMDRIAQGPHPLLRLHPPGRPVERTTGLRLTDTGARVLAGQADQIALNGTDRWIGGVHLHGPRCRGAGTTAPKPSSTSPTRHRSPKVGLGHRRSPGYAPFIPPPSRAVHHLADPAPWGCKPVKVSGHRTRRAGGRSSAGGGCARTGRRTAGR
jgi:hypothetical protein